MLLIFLFVAMVSTHFASLLVMDKHFCRVEENTEMWRIISFFKVVSREPVYGSQRTVKIEHKYLEFRIQK